MQSYSTTLKPQLLHTTLEQENAGLRANPLGVGGDGLPDCSEAAAITSNNVFVSSVISTGATRDGSGQEI